MLNFFFCCHPIAPVCLYVGGSRLPLKKGVYSISSSYLTLRCGAGAAGGSGKTFCFGILVEGGTSFVFLAAKLPAGRGFAKICNFANFHRFKIKNNTTSRITTGGMGFIPLPLKVHGLKVQAEKSIMIARVDVQNITNGADLPIPVFEDGSPASWDEVLPVQIAGTTVAFPGGFFNITATAATDLRLFAVRKRKGAI